MSKQLEIFRVGTHRAMGGMTLAFSEEQVREIVDGYDPELSEAPIVVGHPKTDAPAYGWIKSLGFADGVVTAEPDQVDTDFADLVNDGRYKKISASFFPPKHANNPRPGQYYLKHVGFLGATPPAVKGLKSASFADDKEIVTVEFSDAGAHRDTMLARLLRNLREFFIEKDGREEADKALPEWMLEHVTESAAAERSKSQNLMFAEPEGDGEPKEPKTTNNPEHEEPVMDPNTNDADRQAELDARQAEIEKREADFADAQRGQQHDENVAFVDALVEDGKVAPGVKNNLVGLLDHLNGHQDVSFSDCDDDPAVFLRSLFDAANPVVDFSERSASDEEPNADVAEFALDDGQEVDPEQMALHGKITAYAKKHGVSYSAAMDALGG